MRELGYVEGKNITIEYGQADNKLDRLPALVDEMVHLKVDVLVAASTPAQDLGSTQQWKESQLAGRDLGLQLYSMEASSADEHDSAFNEAVKARNGALAVTLNPVTASNRKLIAGLAAKHRLPAVYARGDFVTSGGLMSYELDQAEPTGA